MTHIPDWTELPGPYDVTKKRRDYDDDFEDEDHTESASGRGYVRPPAYSNGTPAADLPIKDRK